MEIVKDKLYWQNMVQSEIDADSSVVIENHLAANSFLNNRTNIRAVYKFYEKLYTEQPLEIYWPGLATLAGAPVYAGLSDAENSRFLVGSTNVDQFQQVLINPKPLHQFCDHQRAHPIKKCSFSGNDHLQIYGN